jgi:hypothetical protein
LRFRRTYKALFPGDNGPWKDVVLMSMGILLDVAGLFLFFRYARHSLRFLFAAIRVTLL